MAVTTICVVAGYFLWNHFHPKVSPLAAIPGKPLVWLQTTQLDQTIDPLLNLPVEKSPFPKSTKKNLLSLQKFSRSIVYKKVIKPLLKEEVYVTVYLGPSPKAPFFMSGDIFIVAPLTSSLKYKGFLSALKKIDSSIKIDHVDYKNRDIATVNWKQLGPFYLCVEDGLFRVATSLDIMQKSIDSGLRKYPLTHKAQAQYQEIKADSVSLFGFIDGSIARKIHGLILKSEYIPEENRFQLEELKHFLNDAYFYTDGQQRVLAGMDISGSNQDKAFWNELWPRVERKVDSYFSLIPENVVYCQWMTLSWEKVLKHFYVSDVSPKALAHMDQIKNKIVPMMGQQLAIIGHEFVYEQGVPWPQVVVMATVKDVSDLDQYLKKNVLSGAPVWKNESYKDTLIYFVPIADKMGMAYMFMGQQFYLATNRDVLKNYVDVKLGDRKAIGSKPLLRHQTKFFQKYLHQLQYIDFAAVVSELKDMIDWAEQMVEVLGASGRNVPPQQKKIISFLDQEMMPFWSKLSSLDASLFQGGFDGKNVKWSYVWGDSTTDLAAWKPRKKKAASPMDLYNLMFQGMVPFMSAFNEPGEEAHNWESMPDLSEMEAGLAAITDSLDEPIPIPVTIISKVQEKDVLPVQRVRSTTAVTSKKIVIHQKPSRFDQVDVVGVGLLGNNGYAFVLF